MNNILKKNMIFCLFILLAFATLSACGSGSSSSTPTTVPNSETVFYAHNLVFRNSTTLSTGYNGFGSLGTGDLVGRSVPGPLVQYFPFTGFATGTNHSVAFINNSTVRCWGYNALGQLGNNSTAASLVPVNTVFKNNSSLSGIKAVAAGGHHTLALKNDDTLWAWGSNDAGQLGVGGVGASPVAVKVKGLTGSPFSNISSIAANGKHSLVRANGNVWAWGLNSRGQIGLDPAMTGASAAPLNLSSIYPDLQPGIAAIAAGGGFSYAVRANDKTVWAWGNNANGQLGNGTTVSSFSPVQVKIDAGSFLTGVVQVTAGIEHGLARLDNGTVWAWGYNFFGQLGIGKNDDSHFAVQVQLPLILGNPAFASDIRAFGSSSMALVGGDWYVWGDNSFGQLGVATPLKITIPEKMSGF